VISEGAHARRTLAVYRKIAGRNFEVGIIAAEPADYDPAAWWKSSDGVKTTFAEFVGWCYEAFLQAGR